MSENRTTPEADPAHAGELNLPMDRSTPGRLVFWLLLCALPVSMLPVVWMPSSWVAWLKEALPPLYRLYKTNAPYLPAWAQYFGVQTVSVLVVVGLALWYLSTRGTERPERSARDYAFLFLLAAFAGWSVVSYAWSPWRYGTLRVIVRNLPYWVLAAAAMLALGKEERWLTYAKVFAAAAIVQALLQSMLTLGMAAAAEQPFSWRLIQLRFLRYPAFYGNKNFGLAIMITGAYVVVALMARELLREDREERPADWRFMAAGGVGLAAFAFLLLASESLAAFLALAVTAPTYVLCLLRVRWKYLLPAGAILLGLLAGTVLVFSGTTRDRLMDWLMARESTRHLRVMYWTGAARMYAERPMTGWGLGSFPAVYPSFEPPIASGLKFTRDVQNTHAHNEFIGVAAELGLPGFILYCSLLGYAFTVSYTALSGKPLREQLVGYALWCGALSFVMQGMFGKAPMAWCFATNFWLLLGLLASAHWWSRPTAEPAERRLKLSDFQWLGLAVVAGLALWGWWTWGVGGYRSMVSLREAHEVRTWMRQNRDRDTEKFPIFRRKIREIRPRCLWPTETLVLDYLMGEYYLRHGQWENALFPIMERVFAHAPDMLKTRLFAARGLRHVGLGPAAQEQALAYVRRNPYRLEGYVELAAMDLQQAAELLAAHLEQANEYGDLEKVRELITFYLTLDRPDRARALVETARRRAGVQPVEVVVPLAESLRDIPRFQQRLEKLREAFPEILGRQAARPPARARWFSG
ncbi:MAG: O-antigen ligase family protein [Candidatus Brocadiia bacterium]